MAQPKTDPLGGTSAHSPGMVAMHSKPIDLAAIVFLVGLTAAARSVSPQSVRITGTDYAFEVPEHIRAGETVFTFRNLGTVRHEMSLALLKEGFALDSVLASVVAGSARRNWLDGQAALIVSRPADLPGPGLWLNLAAGRTYLVLCTLRDTPEAQPHVMMGMVASFRVE